MGPAASDRAALSRARRSALWSVVRFGLCVFLLSLTASLLVSPWCDLPWWKVFRRCVSVGAAVGLWLCITKFEQRSVQSYGLSADGRGRSQLLLGILLGLVGLGVMLGMGMASGAYRIDVTPDRVRLWRTALGFLPAAAIVSVLEELVFRGFILQHLVAFSRPVAVALSSAAYAIVHLKTTPLFTLGTWLELGGLFLLGSVLALSYLVTNRLSLAIGLHAVLAYGARVNKLVIQFADPSMAWLFGTSRLVNGLMNWLLLLGIGGFIVWWARDGAGRRCEQR